MRSIGIWVLASLLVVAWSGSAAPSYAKDECDKYWYVPGTTPSAENAKGHMCVKLETSKRQGEPDSYFVHIPKGDLRCDSTLGDNCFTIFEEVNGQAGLQTRPGCFIASPTVKICWQADFESFV